MQAPLFFRLISQCAFNLTSRRKVDFLPAGPEKSPFRKGFFVRKVGKIFQPQAKSVFPAPIYKEAVLKPLFDVFKENYLQEMMAVNDARREC